jgi:DNA polymerase sigma
LLATPIALFTPQNRPSGLLTLNLPSRDIDLVVYTKHAKDTEEKRRALYQFKSRLLNAGVARGSDINVVARARIPIIKFRVVPDLGW